MRKRSYIKNCCSRAVTVDAKWYWVNDAAIFHFHPLPLSYTHLDHFRWHSSFTWPRQKQKRKTFGSSQNTQHSNRTHSINVYVSCAGFWSMVYLFSDTFFALFGSPFSADQQQKRIRWNTFRILVVLAPIFQHFLSLLHRIAACRALKWFRKWHFFAIQLSRRCRRRNTERKCSAVLGSARAFTLLCGALIFIFHLDIHLKYSMGTFLNFASLAMDAGCAFDPNVFSYSHSASESGTFRCTQLHLSRRKWNVNSERGKKLGGKCCSVSLTRWLPSLLSTNGAHTHSSRLAIGNTVDAAKVFKCNAMRLIELIVTDPACCCSHRVHTVHFANAFTSATRCAGIIVCRTRFWWNNHVHAAPLAAVEHVQNCN